MSQAYSITHHGKKDHKISLSEQMSREKRFQNKFPPIDSLINTDLFADVYSKIYSQKPEEVYKALSSYPILFLNDNPKTPPPIDIINKFFEFANNDSIFRKISYEASNDLYVTFINFPMIREYLLKNEFYKYLFKHLNESIMINFCEAVEKSPPILLELAKIKAVESVFDHIIHWEDAADIGLIPNQDIYPPMDPHFLPHSTKENVLKSNIYVFIEFLKYDIENAVFLNPSLIDFLMQLLPMKGDIQLAVLDYFKVSMKFSWKILQENGFFSFLLKNCVNEELFDVPQYCASLQILTNATYFCCNYLISEGLFSTIHAAFSKNEDNEYPELFAIELCTAVAKNGPDKITQMISESGPGLLKDFIHYSAGGSYSEKKVYTNLCLELIKYANIPQVSDFLTSVSCVQFIADFLESSIDPIFVDLLQALDYLVKLNNKNSISKDLSDHLKSVLVNSSIIRTLEGFLINDMNTEFNDNQIASALVDNAQVLLTECMELHNTNN